MEKRRKKIEKFINSKVVDKIKAKRKLSKTWQLRRDPLIRTALNKAANELKKRMAE